MHGRCRLGLWVVGLRGSERAFWRRYARGWGWFLIGVGMVFAAVHVRAAPPPGTDMDGPLHHWFDTQHSVTGAWCCRVSDGHVLADKDWRQAWGRYEVHVEGRWVPVPPDALRDPHGGPNPTNSAIVWYLVGGDEAGGASWVNIFCFAPGFEY